MKDIRTAARFEEDIQVINVRIIEAIEARLEQLGENLAPAFDNYADEGFPDEQAVFFDEERMDDQHMNLVTIKGEIRVRGQLKPIQECLDDGLLGTEDLLTLLNALQDAVTLKEETEEDEED